MTRVSPARGITQGTIFSCAVAERYPDEDVYGFVITARCDTAHDKVELINYLPIVPWSSWVRTDGARIVARRARASAVGSLTEVLRAAGLAESILQTIPEPDIAAELGKEGSKEAKARQQRFERLCEERDLCDALLTPPTEQPDPTIVLDRFPKVAKTVFEEVLRHSIPDCHYLEAVEPGEDADGYVILLREIRFIGIDIAAAIADGLDHEMFKRLHPDAGSAGTVQLRLRDSEAFALPVSVVRSPDVEQILQRFTHLFSRVGVEDIDQARKSRLHETLKNLGNPIQ